MVIILSEFHSCNKLFSCIFIWRKLVLSPIFSDLRSHIPNLGFCSLRPNSQRSWVILLISLILSLWTLLWKWMLNIINIMRVQFWSYRRKLVILSYRCCSLDINSSIFPLHHHFSWLFLLIPIGSAVLKLVTPPLFGCVCFLEILLFHGSGRNKIRNQNLLWRLRNAQCLLLAPKPSGFSKFFIKLASSFWLPFPFMLIILCDSNCTSSSLSWAYKTYWGWLSFYLCKVTRQISTPSSSSL